MSSCVPAPHRAEASRIMHTLKRSASGKGFAQLAIDGVYRTYDSRHQVVDYRQLSPEEVQAVVEGFRGSMDPELFRAAEEKFRGVDGRNVTDLQQLLHPGPDVGPQRPSS